MLTHGTAQMMPCQVAGAEHLMGFGSGDHATVGFPLDCDATKLRITLLTLCIDNLASWVE
jgi:hypothetical protein